MITVLFVDICPVFVIGLLLALVMPFGRPVLQKNSVWDYLGKIGRIFTSIPPLLPFQSRNVYKFQIDTLPCHLEQIFQ